MKPYFGQILSIHQILHFFITFFQLILINKPFNFMYSFIQINLIKSHNFPRNTLNMTQPNMTLNILSLWPHLWIFIQKLLDKINCL